MKAGIPTILTVMRTALATSPSLESVHVFSLVQSSCELLVEIPQQSGTQAARQWLNTTRKKPGRSFAARLFLFPNWRPYSLLRSILADQIVCNRFLGEPHLLELPTHEHLCLIRVVR